MAISDVNEINRAADNGTFLQAAFEVIVSNSKNNDTQNVTGIAVDGSGNLIQAISGNIYVVDELTLNEGYTEAGIKNTNTTLMKAAESGAVEGRPGDHTGLYVHNTYNVNVLSDGQLKVNFPGKTLGLITIPGERSDYTELIVGEKYKFAISNFSAAASYSVGNIFTVDDGVWKLTEAESVNAGDVYAVLTKISQFTEGGMYAGTGYVLEIKRKAVTDTVGTIVIANPELSGDEDSLDGIQIDDTKYKISPPVLTDAEVDLIFAGGYTITATITNGTATGDDHILFDDATVTITANATYVLPSAITVTGATYDYNSTTGVITLSDPTENVTITAECTAEV